MTGWAARRFWKEVSVEAAEGGHRVRLDARPLMTPAKRPLILPTVAVAKAVADEWRVVGEKVDPRQMPVTRSASKSGGSGMRTWRAKPSWRANSGP